jgi:predicted ATPase/signal transduction histidine kinase/tRNA A-37 threonylcarbamoyl transferase component Bud32
MSTLPGYSIQRMIFASKRTLIYRAVRKEDERPVVIKMPSREYPPPEELARLRREFAMTQGLAGPGVIGAHELCKFQSSLAMVLEDFGGTSLREALAGKARDVRAVLGLAAEMARIVAGIHAKHVMHKDVNTSNFVYGAETGQLKIIDFGISTELSRETPAILHPNVLEGTLPYMSPEQTGRMNRVMDYRTDLYSLGVSFFEMFTGQLPFPYKDPMELVHCHLARVPPAAHEVRPDLPAAISAIIEKLMAKRAEDRYQSGEAVLADLERCAAELARGGSIRPFALARHDVSAELTIPQKLYGRQREAQALLDAFERVSRGAKEMVLVAGPSGIGKSALVHEVHRPIVRQRGFFISGKFDQYNRDIPYASLIQAFQGMVQQLLTESAERLAAWRAELSLALGPNAQVIIDVIPDVALIMGEQPPVPELPPAEAQNRFNLVFESFVRTLAAADHPLAVFLDDLQWADPPSLRLVELLMTDAGTGHLFLVGAYRDNEVGPSHPLLFTIEEMKKGLALVHRIALGPLEPAHVALLVADALHCAPDRAAPLAAICADKTGGNPFFLNQFLLSLHEEGLVTFDRAASAWTWDMDRIRSTAMTDNVVTLMAGKLGKLPAETQRAVRIAAAIGNSFDLDTLATVTRRPPREEALELWPALREGLVLPVGDAYKLVQHEEAPGAVVYRFLHDRVQQAAYSMIPDGEREALHLEVGRCLYAAKTDEERDERLFSILGHLSLGAAVVKDQEERDRIAELYLRGARKAKASAAHGAALASAKSGLALLGDRAWERHRDLTAKLHLEAAEASQLTADWEGMERYAETYLAHSRSALEQVKVYEIRIAAFIAQAKIVEAIGQALEVLHLLGIDFPADPQPPDVMAALGATMADLAATGREIEALADLPEAEDPAARAALRILANITSATYIGRPALFPLIVFKQVSLSATRGNTNASAYGYATYGIILCGVVGDIDAGYRFGQMALLVSQRFNAKEYEARTTYITCCYTRLWKEHVRETFRTFPAVYQAALESGDKEFAAWALMMRAMQGFYLGRDLREREPETARYVKIIEQLEQTAALHPLEATHQAILNLMGRNDDPKRLVGGAFDEPSMLALHRATGESFAICNIHLNQAMLSYLMGDPEEALRNSAALDPFAPAMVALVHVPVFLLYDSLARLAVDARLSPEDRAASRARVEKQRAELAAFARFAPQNHLHKQLLVEAEIARADGRAAEARALHRRAIDLAREGEYQQEEALGNELLGELWIGEGEPELARVYLSKARHLYEVWGAAAKARQMEQRHPEIAVEVPRAGTLVASATTVEDAASTLDITSVLKATQAISGEVVLSEALKKILAIAMENAGAERGLLLLDRDGVLAIEIEAEAGGEPVLRSSAPLAGDTSLSAGIVNYVARRRESLVLSDASAAGLFTSDPYVAERRARSVLCSPLLNQGRLVGVLYLENNLTSGAFTQDRLELLRLLSAQAALTLHNARLYASLEEHNRTLEQKVDERTRQLSEALEDLRRTQRQLVAQEKLASLGLLTSGIAHELRNPLNFVINFAGLTAQLAADLRAELGGAGAAVEDIVQDIAQNADRIGQHGRRADDIVRTMLRHAGKGGAQREETDLNTVVRESVRSAEAAFEGLRPGFAVALETQLDPSLDPVFAAPQEVAQVVANLVSNACYAVWERSRSAGAGYAPRVIVETRDAGGHAEIRVRDNGAGIPAGVREKIFLPFFTTKPSGEGTGLGLSLTHDIVAAHSGTLDLSTEVGQGTEVVVRLPKGPEAGPTSMRA